MKKSLLALAVLGAFAGVAQAQTSVTLYGSIDAGLRRLGDVNSAGDSQLKMSSNGTYNSNRLGFKGVEDLGGGLNAHFNLESGFNSGTGAFDNTPATGASTLLFNRAANVGIGGAWGSLDLGRQYTVAYRTTAVYDPFNYKYTSFIPLSGLALSGSRLNNDIQATAIFGPATVRAEYALGEQVGSTSAGSTKAIGATFAAGPFSAGAAYSKRDATTTGTIVPDGKNWTVGGAFATGPFRVAAGYMNEKLDPIAPAVVETKKKSVWFGGSYNFTPDMALTAALYRFKTEVATEGTVNQFVVGGTYALSKRTNFYADVDINKLKDAAVATTGTLAGVDRQTNFSVGINHVF